ncbi:MAG: hypothetical protein KDA85_19235, partial [Planctomycetaceae bacterium]|nr:hypothetical protein [Planctomycetaceae bacterium]
MLIPPRPSVSFAACSRATACIPVVRLSAALLLFAMLSATGFAAERDNGKAQHPISIMETRVYVTPNHAVMQISLFAEDLLLFDGLEPNEQDVLPATELRRGIQLHRDFLLEKISLRDVNGDRIPGNITNIAPFEIPEEGIASSELMSHSAEYTIEFPFTMPPEFLTFQQDVSDPNFIFRSEMKLAIHQAGTDITYTTTLKPGDSETHRFDWNAEPLSEDATDDEWRQWLQQRREQTLGIESYGSVYSFIYVEPAELRHELLIPLATLKTFLPLQHAAPDFVEVAEQEAVRDLIREWLQNQNPVTLNGTTVAPVVSRID